MTGIVPGVALAISGGVNVNAEPNAKSQAN